MVSIFATDTHGSEPRARVSGPDFLDVQARTTTLTDPAVFRDGRAALIRNGQSQTLTVSYATANLFAAMGQRAIRGRAFEAGDDRPGAPPVALLSHHYWQREWMGRDAALGATMQIGREHFTVVGVLSPDIEFGNIGEIDVWLPLRLDPMGPRDARTMRFLARLKRRHLVRSGGGRAGGDRRFALEGIPRHQRRLAVAADPGVASSPAARASGWSSRCSCCRSGC